MVVHHALRCAQGRATLRLLRRRLADLCFHVKVHDMQIAEDVHLIMGHILMRILEVGK